MTSLIFNLDKSGSMCGTRNILFEGLGQFINSQKQIQQHAPDDRITINFFNQYVDPFVVDQPINDLDLQDISNNYKPEGLTSIHDAFIESTYTNPSEANMDKLYLSISQKKFEKYTVSEPLNIKVMNKHSLETQGPQIVHYKVWFIVSSGDG